MTRLDIIAGMDIGTSSIKLLVCKITANGSINIIGAGTSPSEGIKKGVIIDLKRAVASITKATAEAERMAGAKINFVNVGIAGSHISLVNNRGVVAVARDDKEITEQDVERVLQVARVIALPRNKEIIDVIPKEFIVDGYDGIRDPVGMLGVRLEVGAMIITGDMTPLHNLLRCLEMAHYEVNALVLHSLANGEVCLSRDEKELGVLLIDLGGGTTEVSYFHQGGLIDIAVLPVRGEHITNDLAIGLKTTFQIAEKLKIEQGFALEEMASAENEIEIEGISGKDKRIISPREIVSFIEPRVEEIIHLCNQEIVRMGFTKMPPAGVVLTGGGSLLRGITDYAESVFECPVRVAHPEYPGVKSPVYSTAVGIIHYVVKNQTTSGRPKKVKGAINANIWQRVRAFIAEHWE